MANDGATRDIIEAIDEPYAFFLPNMGIGGVERMTVHLLEYFDREGVDVELVLADATGEFLSEVPASVPVVNLDANEVPGYGMMGALPDLVSYLRERRPATLISCMSHVNVITVLAHTLANVDVRLVISQRNHFSSILSRQSLPKRILMRTLMRVLYPRADEIIAISNGVKDDIVDLLNVDPRSISVIYNPVVTAELTNRAAVEIDHAWFAADEPPVVLGVGRLVEQKDFATLLRAFVELRRNRPARLVLLGDGEKRESLESLADLLGIANDVAFLGYVENPYPYMRAASAFALSSRWEGFGNVLVEAMACGCPVVATDCPSGPREILSNGEYGPLVPVGSPDALKEALCDVLDDPPDESTLRDRAADFTVERIGAEWESLL